MLKTHTTRLGKLAAGAAAFALLTSSASVSAQPVAQPNSFPDIDGIWFTDTPASFGAKPEDLLPPYDAVFAETRKALAEGRPTGDATTNCFPAGMPRVMLAPYPMEIRQTKDQVTILFEYMQQTMRVHMDGRPLPEDPDPAYMGYSVGKWDDGTLTITTIGRNGLTQLDGGLTPHSDQLNLEFRVKRQGDQLHLTTIATDAKAFRRPLTQTKIYDLRNDIEIMEYNCVENNRNPSDASGNTLFILRDEVVAADAAS